MFRIGEFSKLSRVSVRMLRHYDQLGLLTPSHTDTFTSYRYYTADQLPRLNRILALRDLGFSLDQIAGMLDEELSAEQLLGMLRLKKAEIAQQVELEQLRMERLEARITQMNDRSNSNQYDIVVRAIEPQLVAALREVAPDDDRIQYMFEELEHYVAHFDARSDKPTMTIYHDGEYRENDIDAEVVVPLKFAIPGKDDFRVIELPRISQAACVAHKGSYTALYQAYNALLGWIETNGYRMAGPIREVYLSYSADDLGFDLPSTYLAKQPGQFVTELQIEIEKL